MVKVAHRSYDLDDNENEFVGGKTLPQWLVPPVFFFGRQILCGEEVIILVVQKFSATIGAISQMVQTLPFNLQNLGHYSNVICRVFLLLWRLAVETDLEAGDWHLENVGISEWPQGDVRLIDWAGTTANAIMHAYTRVKKARVSFLRDMLRFSLHEPETISARK